VVGGAELIFALWQYVSDECFRLLRTALCPESSFCKSFTRLDLYYNRTPRHGVTAAMLAHGPAEHDGSSDGNRDGREASVKRGWIAVNQEDHIAPPGLGQPRNSLDDDEIVENAPVNRGWVTVNQEDEDLQPMLGHTRAASDMLMPLPKPRIRRKPVPIPRRPVPGKNSAKPGGLERRVSTYDPHLSVPFFPSSPVQDEVSDLTPSRNGTPGESAHSGVSSPGVEAPMTHGWRPSYLRRRIIVAFIVVFVAIIIAIEAMYGYSKTHHGVARIDESLELLWTFGPTAGKEALCRPIYSYALTYEKLSLYY
jgi:hypothetical protein